MYVGVKQTDTKCSPITEHESGFGLCLIVGRRRTTNDERGPGVTSETLLKDSSQLAVTIGDEWFLGGEIISTCVRKGYMRVRGSGIITCGFQAARRETKVAYNGRVCTCVRGEYACV